MVGVRVAVEELLAGTGSVVPVVTVAVLDTAAVWLEARFTVTAIAAGLAPTASGPGSVQCRVAPTVPAGIGSQVQPAPAAETKPAPAGSGSVTVTGPAAEDGPRLDTASW